MTVDKTIEKVVNCTEMSLKAIILVAKAILSKTFDRVITKFTKRISGAAFSNDTDVDVASKATGSPAGIMETSLDSPSISPSLLQSVWRKSSLKNKMKIHEDRCHPITHPK